MLNACATVEAPVSTRDKTQTPAEIPVTSTGEVTTRGKGFHTVDKGDTLYSIAWRYGLDYKELAAWNRIRSPYLIYPGQMLRLKRANRQPRQRALQPGPIVNKKAVKSAHGKPVGENVQTPEKTDRPSTQSGVIHWQWPTRGRLLKSASPTSKKGIGISGEIGQKVVAAAGGEVVYSGNGFLGYGKLIIIKHSEIYLSAYAHNNKLIVNEGDKVKAGQQIATMGLDSKGAPALHFEIRKNGKPVNPLHRLPRV